MGYNLKFDQYNFIFKKQLLNSFIMISRPYRLQKSQKSISTLSPRVLKKPKYIRLKTCKDKSSKTAKSLRSIDAPSLRVRDDSKNIKHVLMSHRKLVSASSVEEKTNLTERKNNFSCKKLNPQCLSSRKQLLTVRQHKRKSPYVHLRKFQMDEQNEKIAVLSNEEENDNLEQILSIKENILRGFIDHFQEQLRELNHQKSSRKTLSLRREYLQNHQKSHRLTTQHCERKSGKDLKSLQAHHEQSITQGVEKNKQTNKNEEQKKQRFESYLKQLKVNNEKKTLEPRKILLLKNSHGNMKQNNKLKLREHKKSYQNISISRLIEGKTQELTCHLSKRILEHLGEDKSSRRNMNLKKLFKHSDKYQPFLQDRVSNQQDQRKNGKIQNPSEVQVKISSQEMKSFQEDKDNQKMTFKHDHREKEMSQNTKKKKVGKKSLLEESCLSTVNLEQRGGRDCLIECSSIERVNQSSFISQTGKKSLLKQFDGASAQKEGKQNKRTSRQSILRGEGLSHRKSKKCLSKLKNIFPTDFF